MNDFSRREFLQRAGMGLPALGLASMLQGEIPTAARKPHFKPKAKYVIHLFMNGGPSHVDTFDPKPILKKYAGKKLPVHYKTERPTGAAFPSPFKFKKYGQSGIEISELFRHLGPVADELCVIRSMHTNVPNHEPSLMMMNCGDIVLPRPSMGSWINYGLGTENQNLPGFVAICPGGYPIKGTANWRSSFLPGIFQGTHIDTKNKNIKDLIKNIKSHGTSKSSQSKQLQLLKKLNKSHAKKSKDPQLEARIQSFQLAYNMQMEATDAFDVNKEPKYIREMYGNSVQARSILTARRLVERGVRFVQIYHGKNQPWDHHDDLVKGHTKLAGECSQAIGALIMDLKQRGMLDETLIIWGGEFGRTPVVELPKPGSNKGKVNGRDHNNHGFTMWMAGGGVNAGTVYGATDDFGFKAVKDRVHIHDLHATILALMGMDHEKLTYRFSGRDFRLTDVHGFVIEDLIG